MTHELHQPGRFPIADSALPRKQQAQILTKGKMQGGEITPGDKLDSMKPSRKSSPSSTSEGIAVFLSLPIITSIAIAQCFMDRRNTMLNSGGSMLKITTILVDFASWSTVACVRNVVYSESRWLRFVWFIVFLVMWVHLHLLRLPNSTLIMENY